MERSGEVRTESQRSETTTFHQTLILLFSALYFAFWGGGAALEERVADAMDDPAHPEREERALELARRMDGHSGTKVQQFVDWRRRLYADLSEPDWSETQVGSRFDEALRELESLEKEYLDLWMELRGELNATEWSKLFPED